jgi:hypothetical protein
LKVFLNCRTKNRVEAANPAEQGGQQQLKREIVRAGRFDTFVSRRKVRATS